MSSTSSEAGFGQIRTCRQISDLCLNRGNRGKQKQCRMRAEMCLEFYGYGGEEADQSVRILGCKHTRVVTVWVDQLSLSCAGSDARR